MFAVYCNCGIAKRLRRNIQPTPRHDDIFAPAHVGWKYSARMKRLTACSFFEIFGDFQLQD